MPPGAPLTASETAALEEWVKRGAVWPRSGVTVVSQTQTQTPAIEPDDTTIRPALQAWYRADRLPLSDGKPVTVWPDQSGKGRDLAATAGVRKAGVGTPPVFAMQGSVNRRPAVRFDVGNGLASSPDLPVDIKGDAALTMVVVMKLQPHQAQPPYDGVLCVGDPANPGADPGKALAGMIQIERTGAAELQFAGGWNHNATLGRGSFQPFYNQPLLLTIVKTPGPMNASAHFFLNGRASAEAPYARQVGGRNTVPAIRHRTDIGLYMGKALDWCGSIKGDVSEVIVYNSALTDAQRTALETGLALRYGLVHPSVALQSRAHFTAQQRQFWAFQPVRAVKPPTATPQTSSLSPIDRFLRAKLAAAGLRPSPPADRRALIRRLFLDLIGLPPTSDEVDAFLADKRPDAYDRLVDRLLDSPHYGERWARHWLDVVRYAETTANDANAVMRYAHRYRDYVARAFNQDKPYDRFVHEQLAGDLLPDAGSVAANTDRIIATGFLMIGPKALAEADIEGSRMDIVDDQIDVTSRAFLGMTVSCARCHDHKFDPIPTSDYYSLAGIFRGAEVFRDENRGAVMWHEYPVPQGPGEPPMMVMAPREGIGTNLPVALRGNRQTPGILAPRRMLQIVSGEGCAPLQTAHSGRVELADWIASPANPLTARVMVNRLWQHHFGTGLVATSDNFGVRGEKPSHPELLDWLASEFIRSGWSLKAMHRLMLRTAAYRMSSHPNAEALKRDPNNRLLWRMPLTRLDAETYRDAMLSVSGRLDPTIGGSESGELLYEAGEVIDKKRDFFRPNRVQADHPIYTESRRRSLYLPVVRNAVPDVFALFDSADPNGVTAVRNDSTVASQSLYLLNHPFVREQALQFARKMLELNGADRERISAAYRRALGRPPTVDETDATLRFLESYAAAAMKGGSSATDARLAAWQSFCQSLFTRNEFLYVD